MVCLMVTGFIGDGFYFGYPGYGINALKTYECRLVWAALFHVENDFKALDVKFASTCLSRRGSEIR